MMTRGLGGICRAAEAGADSAYDAANMETSIHPRVVVYYDDGCSILGGVGYGSVLPLLDLLPTYYGREVALSARYTAC